MYLIDSSVWVEYLRRTGSPAHLEVRRLVHEQPSALAFTEPIAMELLAGASGPQLLEKLEKLIAGLPLLAVDALVDYRAAATAARTSRRLGHPIRSIVDCLIAAVAVRTEAELVHRDRDFDRLADCLPDLRVHQF